MPGMSALRVLALALLAGPISSQLNFGETLQSASCSFANFQTRVDEAACWCTLLPGVVGDPRAAHARTPRCTSAAQGGEPPMGPASRGWMRERQLCPVGWMNCAKTNAGSG